jgi:hypothetical protein
MTELAVRDPDAYLDVPVNLLQPLATLDEAMHLADVLSRSTLVPRALQGKPANVLHVILTGQNLDLHWTEAVRVIYSPGEGQIGMRGSFLLSRLRRAGHTYREKFSEDGTACTFHLTRGDTKEEFEATFNLDDAVQGGLLKRTDDGRLVALSREGKPLPWMSWTRRMLRWRAVSECVSFAAPEVSLGFEIEGSEPAAESKAEVELKPDAQPAAAAPAGPPAAAAGLRDLDQRMRAAGNDQRAPGRPAGGSGNVDESWAQETGRGESGAMKLAAELERADASAVRDDDIPDPADAPGAAPSGTTPGPASGATTAASPSRTGASPRATSGVPGGLGNTEPLIDPDCASGKHETCIGEPCECPCHSNLDDEPAQSPGRAAAQAKSQILAERFTALGWTPRKYRAEVLRACSMYFRRKVGGVREMTASEMSTLAEELSRLQRKHMNEPDVYPVAMADKAEEWRESWEQADIAGYERYTEEMKHEH